MKEMHSPKVTLVFLHSSITYDSVQMFQLKCLTNSCYTNVFEGKIRGTKSEVTSFTFSMIIKNGQGMYATDMPDTLQKTCG